MKKVSVKDIAELSGVSVATVSRVINNNGRFSEETRKKVLKVIEETGYEMNYSAKTLRTNRSYTIGILVPDISNYFFADVVQKIEFTLFEKGYSTIICNTGRDEKKEMDYLKVLQGKGVDGLIVISGAEEFSFDYTEAKKEIPYICIDREPKDKSQTTFISSNHYQGAFEVTEQLIKLGCTQPIFAVLNRKSTSAKTRLAGFKDALNKHSFTFNEANVLYLDNPPAKMKEQTQTFFKNYPETNGILATNDTIALELLNILHTMNYKVPEQIKVIGFDDSPITNYSSPPLSSVQQDTSKIADTAANHLLHLIQHPNETGQTLMIPVHLILRQSSAI